MAARKVTKSYRVRVLLNFRAAPALTAEILRELQPGETVEKVTAPEKAPKGWIYVKAGEMTGWCMEEYLEVI